MRNILINIITFLIPIISFSQESMLSIDFYIQPKINSKIDNSYIQEFLDSRYKIGIDFGVGVTYSVNERVGLSSGLELQNFGFQNYAGPFLNSNEDEGLENVKSYFNYNFITIPLRVYYRIYEFSFLNISSYAGINIGYLLNDYVKIKYNFENSTKTEYKNLDTKNENKYNIGINFGLEFSKSISDKYSIYLSPNYYYVLNRLEKDISDANNYRHKTYFWNIGCKIGLIRKI